MFLVSSRQRREWLLLSALAVACHSRRDAEVASYEMMASGAGMAQLYATNDEFTKDAYAAPRPSAPAPAGRAAKMAAPAAAMGGYPAPPPMEEPSPEVAGEEVPAADRLVHYDGFARLRVGKLDEASDALVKIATDAGGRVESLTRTRLVLRVPVDRFRELFETMLATGDVLDRNISAQDVTEAFQSLELRLQSAKASRERLQALLAKAKDEREKIMLLQRLQRLAEIIDQLESQSRTVADLASMSRITVELVPRESVVAAAVQETGAFAWIRGLSPFHDVLADAERLQLEVPEGMVALDLKKRFIAESADGARVRAGRRVNAPEGTSNFWIDAVQQRLAPEFAKSEVTTSGEWQVLRLVDRSDEPYIFVIAVRAAGEHLDLVEVYYPSVRHEERYRAAVAAMLGGGAA